MRRRVSNGLVPYAPVYEYHSFGGATGPIYSGLNIGTYKSFEDVSIRNYSSRIAKGEVFFNPLRQSAVSWGSPTGSGYGHKSKSTGEEHTVDSFPGNWIVPIYGKTSLDTIRIPSGLSDSDIQNLQVEAATAALSQRGRSDANSWETLAEMGKTVKTLRHPIESFWRKFRKKEFRAASASISASNAHLIWRYALSPLIKDVSAILKSLHDGPEPLPIRKTTRKKAETSRIWSSQRTAQHGPYTLSWIAQYEDKVKVRATSLDEETIELGKILGFDGKSLATLPWELVRYSFVVDWFANIGDYLGSLADVVNSNKHLGGCITTERWLTARITATCVGTNSAWILTRSPDVNLLGIEYVKDRSTSLPSPGIVMRGDFHFDEVKRIADALALIGQKVLPLIGAVPRGTRRWTS